MAVHNDISNKILQKIVDSDTDNVVLDSDNFLTSLASSDKRQFRKRTARLIAVTFVSIAMIAFVIYCAVFYIQNVLLFSGELQVNQFGTFIRKSYNSEYAMYLFDASEQWAPSGVQVQKGDKLIISASGAFHTNYKQLVGASNDNRWSDYREYLLQMDKSARRSVLDTITKKAETYRYIFMTRAVETQRDTFKQVVNGKTITDTVSLLRLDTLKRLVRCPVNYTGDTAYFGDVLFQVVPEQQVRNIYYTDKSNRIYALPRPSWTSLQKKSVINIEQDGLLAFCVNDIKPANNIGQILVVVEVFHKYDKSQAIRNILHGRIMDWPYWWHNYLSHRFDYPSRHLFSVVWSDIVLILLVFFEVLVMCTLLYILPFLFIPETWIKVRYVYQHKVKTFFVKHKLCHKQLD